MKFRQLGSAATILASLFLAANELPAQAAQNATPIEVAPQPLAEAIQSVARQTNTNILVDPRLVAGREAPAISQTLTVNQALDKLLQGTGLTPKFVDERTITLVVAPAVGTSGLQPGGGGPTTFSTDSDQQPRSESEKEGKISSSHDFRLAQAAAGSNQGAVSVGAPSGGSALMSQASALQEVVVTAQKREERLQDVPVPVSVIDADGLANSNQVLIRDYFSSVPGLNLAPAAGGAQFLSIRGIISGQYTNPTVGIVIDDVPYGSSFAYNNIPDFDTGDLARIEVLRGPQGTLYGASSMGGLIKYVTQDPSTAGYSGRVEVGTSNVYNGAQPGFNLRGSLNIPLGDELAMRVSGFRRQDPGYVDDILDGRKGVNEAQANGARMSVLWRPSDALSLKVSALYQSIRSMGAPDVLTGPGYVGLQENFVPQTGGTDRNVQAYSATLKAKLGSVDLTSLTGYNINKDTDNEDQTPGWGLCCTSKLFPGVTGSVLTNREKTSKFTQELRASVPIGENFEWLIGAFYTHEYTYFYQNIWAVNQDTGAIIAQTGLFNAPATYQEYAGFTDLTYHVTDRFDIQVGGRDSHITAIKNAGYTIDPEFGAPDLEVQPALRSSANAFTYLVTPSFKIRQDLMVYARFASGYRPGGPNGVIVASIPPGYKPDKTENYELGLKGDFLDHALTTDLSVYYIDWSNIEIQLHTPPPLSAAYTSNGSGAKSQGVEASVAVRPLKGLTLTGWFAYTDAELTKAFPDNSPTYGIAGDRLPFSSRYAANFSLEQNFPLGGNATGFVGGLVSYVGNRTGLFESTAVRQYYPAYTRADLHAGFRYDSWTANVFVNNVGDERGVTNGGIGYVYTNGFVYIQPRTIGVNLAKSF